MGGRQRPPISFQSTNINRKEFTMSYSAESIHDYPSQDDYSPPTPILARIPRAPKTASPVPHLTSLYHFDDAGRSRDRNYPGNCGGNLIEDLLRYFKPGQVLDPMAGSGTCADVCHRLGIACMSFEIHQGIDACDEGGFPPTKDVDFIWAHPPY